MSIRLRILLALLFLGALGAPLAVLLGALGAPARGAPAYVVADLGTLPGGANSVAFAINARGQVAGSADAAGGHAHAFRTSATGTLADPGADLGTLPGGADSEATALNDRGQVAGDALAADGHDHPFRISATGTLADPGADLGSLPNASDSWALALNDRGQVVGFADDGAGPDQTAFLYDDAATPRMRDLNALIPAGSGVALEEAVGINDTGQIAATGTVHGQRHAFRLTPVGLARPVGIPTRRGRDGAADPGASVTEQDTDNVGLVRAAGAKSARPVALCSDRCATGAPARLLPPRARRDGARSR